MPRGLKSVRGFVLESWKRLLLFGLQENSRRPRAVPQQLPQSELVNSI